MAALFLILHLSWAGDAAESAATGAGTQGSRPNVLLLMGDDHAAYALGCYGSPIAQTPHLDRLAAEGMRFERVFCNSPVCTPSRQSLLTGRLPHAVGVTLLTNALSSAELTLAEHLKAGGYETVSIGKMHFNSALKHGFDVRIDQPQHRAWLRTNASPALNSQPFSQTNRVQPPWRPFRDPARIWLNSEALPVASREQDMDATFFANEAARVLKQRRTRPLFLMVSFYQPHSPFNFPLEYAGKVDPARFTLPEVAEEDLGQVPLIFRDLTERQKRGINAAYYTAVTFLDSRVGVVL